MTCERNPKRPRTYFQEREGEKQRFGIRNCVFQGPIARAFVTHNIEATNALKNWLKKHGVTQGQEGVLCFKYTKGEEKNRVEMGCAFKEKYPYLYFVTDGEIDTAQELALRLKELGIKRKQEGILLFEF